MNVYVIFTGFVWFSKTITVWRSDPSLVVVVLKLSDMDFGSEKAA